MLSCTMATASLTKHRMTTLRCATTPSSAPTSSHQERYQPLSPIIASLGFYGYQQRPPIMFLLPPHRTRRGYGLLIWNQQLQPTAAWDPGSMLHVVEALQVEPVSLQALPRAAYTIRNNTRLLPLISQQEYCNAPKPTTLPHSCLRRLHGQMDQIMDRRTSQCPLQDNSGVLCPDPRFSLRCRGF